MNEEEILIQRSELLASIVQEVRMKTGKKFADWSKEERLLFMRELEKVGFFQVVQVIKTEYIEKPPVTPPEQLQRQRECYQRQKELKAERDEEARRQLKITNSIKNHNKMFCFRCKQKIDVDVTKTNSVIKLKHGIERIILENKCPICQNVVREAGGTLKTNGSI